MTRPEKYLFSYPWYLWYCRITQGKDTLYTGNYLGSHCGLHITASAWLSKASRTLSLYLCPYFMGSVVRQASFLFHISQQFLPILEGTSVEKSKLRQGKFHYTLKNRWEMCNGCNFRVITIRGCAFPFHGPVNWDEAGNKDLNSKLCCPKLGECIHIGGWCVMVMQRFMGIFTVFFFVITNWD